MPSNETDMTGHGDAPAPAAEQEPQDRFAVYFDGIAHLRRVLGNRIAIGALVFVMYLLFGTRHRRYSPTETFIVLGSMAAFVLIPYIFQLIANYRYTSFCKSRKAWLEFDKAGIKIRGDIYFPWAAISSLEYVHQLYTNGRNVRRVSFLILNFPDQRALSSVPPEFRFPLTADAQWIRLAAKKEQLHLNAYYASVRVGGGATVTANLSAADSLIELMAQHYFNLSRREAKHVE